MFYPQYVLEEVRMGNDIVDVIGAYTALSQKGSSYFGLCPFHKERTPSFSVSADKQLFHCFGCGVSGNVVGFVMQIENYTFPEAVKHLAERIHYTLPEEEFSAEAKQKNQARHLLIEIHKKAARYYFDRLNEPEAAHVVRYLDERQISLSVRAKFGLGYAPDTKDGLYKYLLAAGYDSDIITRAGLALKSKYGNHYDKFRERLMFPIIDAAGHVIGFGGRILGTGEPKYLNSPETEIFSKSKNLYNINLAKLARSKELILVEGYMDAIKIYQAGFKHVAASLGTAFNDEHAKQVKKYAQSAILLFDADDAGVNAALRAIPVLTAHGLRVRVTNTAPEKDPDEYIKKQGPAAFAELLENAQNYISFQVHCIRKRYNMHNTEHKILFTNEIAGLLASVTNEIEQDVHIKEAAALTHISAEAIKAEINKRSAAPIPLELTKKTYSKQKFEVAQTGLLEARKNILSLCVHEPDVLARMKTLLLPEEFAEENLVRFCELLYEHHTRRQTIYAAEMLNYFTEVESQKQISEIFLLEQSFADEREREKAIADQIRLIKTAYIDDALGKTTDVTEQQQLINRRKALAIG